MKKKSLLATSPYLRDRRKYEKALTLNVASSTAVETGSFATALRTLKQKIRLFKKAA